MCLTVILAGKGLPLRPEYLSVDFKCKVITWLQENCLCSVPNI